MFLRHNSVSAKLVFQMLPLVNHLPPFQNDNYSVFRSEQLTHFPPNAPHPVCQLGPVFEATTRNVVSATLEIKVVPELA